MSNTCPKCGAEPINSYDEFMRYKCGTLLINTVPIDIDESDRCRGRAEAIAELDAKILILTRALSKIADCTDDAEAADCATDALYKWREVRP